MKMQTSRLLGKISHSPEEALSEIATRLRSGHPDKLLLSSLAEMIDPKSKKWCYGVRLILKRTKGGGAPKKPVDWDMARFIQERIDRGEKAEAAVASAMEKYSVSRTTCFEALASLRDSRKLARAYRELGHALINPWRVWPLFDSLPSKRRAAWPNVVMN